MGKWSPEHDEFIRSHPEMTGRELWASLGGLHGAPDNYSKRRERLRHKDEARTLVESGTITPAVFPPSAMPDARNSNVVQANDFVVISDLHAPHQDAAFLGQVTELAQSWGIRQCVVNGDTFDHAAFSTHGRLEHDPSFGDELKAVRAIIAALSGAFEQVVLTLGNHEHRLLRRHLNSALHVDDWEWLFNRSDNVRVINYNHVFIHGAEKWLAVHPKRYSKIPAKVATDIHIENFPDHHVIGAHDHSVGIRQRKTSIGTFYLVSSGCCALTDTFEYSSRDVDGMASMSRGAIVVKDGYPWLVTPSSPFEAMQRMYA